MLYKEELKKVPLCSIPKLSKAKLKGYEIVARAQVVDLHRSGNILNIDYYSIEKKQIQARFFYNKETYICFDVATNRFHQNYIYGSFYDKTLKQSFTVYSDNQDVSLALKYFRKSQASLTSCYIDSVSDYYRCVSEPASLLSLADNHIQEIKRDRRWRAVLREDELFVERQLWFPEDESYLKQFCNEKVFSKAYIFFSNKIHYKGKKRKCYCTHCKKSWFTTESPKHKSFDRCPKCGAYIQYYSERFETNICNKNKIATAIKHGEDIGMKWMNCSQTYFENAPRITLEDIAYTFWVKRKGEVKKVSYFYATNFYGGGVSWTKPKNNEETHKRVFISPYGLNSVFGEKYYNVDLEKILGNQKKPIDFIQLLNNLKTSPQTEYMCKHGLVSLASELNEDDYACGNTFESSLGISGQYLPMYQALDINATEHRIIRSCKERVHPQTMLEFRRIFDDESYIDDEKISDCLNYQRLDTLVKYIKKEMPFEDVGPGRIVEWLSDYYQTNLYLDVEINKANIRPRELKKQHDLVVERYNKLAGEVKDEYSRKLLSQVNAFFKGYSSDKYTVKMPEYKSDFIREGQSLHHCVGTNRYFKNHIKGVNLIFFIRKLDNPEKPYVTAEVNVEKYIVKQCYGAHDPLPPKPVKEFVDKFVLYLKAHSKAVRKAG